MINTRPEDVVIKRGAHLGNLLLVEGVVIADKNQTARVRQAKKTNPWQGYEKLRKLVDEAKSLDATQRERLGTMLAAKKASFSSDKGELGRTNLVLHDIQTGASRPIKQPPRRVPPQHREKVDELVEDMLSQGVIEPSTSPWASPIVLVKKKDGSLRFCVDYRKLNAVTEKDAYPLPRIDDTISAFNGAQWFSTLDLTSGYWQVGMTEEAQKKAAFCLPGGLYQFKVLSFGLCNAPGTFERLMERVLAGLSWKSCLLYLDDIIVYSRTFEEHVSHLGEVLDRIQEAGMKLKPSKCQLFCPEVSFLGHIIGRDGVRTDPTKTEAIERWATPRNVTDVRSFLGLCGYYRKFVHKFSEIAAPLHELTKKRAVFEWELPQEDAFQTLKEKLVTAPILSYPRDHGRFVLDTDASDTGIGAVLSQEQDGHERVLMYLSRSLTKEERRYCVTRKELLAVVYSVQQCKQYLLGRRFLIRTDHGSLTWLTNFKEPQGQIARWIEILSPYDYSIQHRPGRSHQNADALSRDPCTQCGKVDWKQAKIDAWEGPVPARQGKSRGRPRKEMSAVPSGPTNQKRAMPVERPWTRSQVQKPQEPSAPDAVSAGSPGSDSAVPGPSKGKGGPFKNRVVVPSGKGKGIRPPPAAKTDSTPEEQTRPPRPRKQAAPRGRVAAPVEADRPVQQLGGWLIRHEPEEIQQELQAEPWYPTTRAFLRGEPLPHNFAEMSRDEKTLYGMRRQLEERDGLIYRRWRNKNRRVWKQLLVPKKFRRELFQLAHALPTGGHLGPRRVMGSLQRRYFWPGMLTDVKLWALACEECASRSPHLHRKAQMQKYRVGRPMERVAMDIMGPLPLTTRGNRYILVIGDYFSKWIEAYPMPNQEAKTVADKVTREFIVRYGAPLEIHSDQGRNFESAIMKDVCAILGIHKTRTTAFHPQSDGFIERFNRTLQQMLSLYINDKQTDWDQIVPLVLAAYRATPQETTGQSPNLLMMGREVMLPVDLAMGIPPGDEPKEVTEYGVQLRDDMEQVFEVVRKRAGRAMERQKRYYDRRKVNPKEQTYARGAMVWVAEKNRTPGKAPKLQRRWRGPAVVIKKYSDVTYLVREKGGRERVVHFDLLKPYMGERRPRWIVQAQREVESPHLEGTPTSTEVEDAPWSSASSDDE